MKGVKSQGMTCHVPYSSDSGIHREESPEDASGSEEKIKKPSFLAAGLTLTNINGKL